MWENQKKKYHSLNFNNTEIKKNNNIKNISEFGILKRQMITQESKKLKVQILKSQKDEKEMQECKFLPKIVRIF